MNPPDPKDIQAGLRAVEHGQEGTGPLTLQPDRLAALEACKWPLVAFTAPFSRYEAFQILSGLALMERLTRQAGEGGNVAELLALQARLRERAQFPAPVREILDQNRRALGLPPWSATLGGKIHVL